MSLFKNAIQPIGRLSTRLLTTSRPSAVSAQSISRLTSHKPQTHTRQLQTTPRRQADQESDSSHNKPPTHGKDFVSIEELWDLPADPQMADILPHPWRPRDLGTVERIWYKKYGPTFAAHPDVNRETLSVKVTARANRAKKWAKKYGPDWYDIRAESFHLVRERRRQEAPAASAERVQWLDLSRKLLARKLELKNQGAKDKDSPLHQEYFELVRRMRQVRWEHAAKEKQSFTSEAAMDEIFKRRGGVRSQNK